jgi:hypothetical protein
MVLQENSTYWKTISRLNLTISIFLNQLLKEKTIEFVYKEMPQTETGPETFVQEKLLIRTKCLFVFAQEVWNLL